MRGRGRAVTKGWEGDGSNGEEPKAASGTGTGASGLTHSVGGTVAEEGDKRKELDWTQARFLYVEHCNTSSLGRRRR